MKKSTIFKPAVLSIMLGMGAMMTMGTANADDAPKSLNEDAVSLLQAIEIAKNNTGGVPLEAERDVEMGQALYEIELTGKNGEEIRTVIDAQTGKVILTKNRSNHDDDHDDQLENALLLSGINSGKYLSLEQAVKQSEAAFNGKAWSVEIDDDHNSLSYEVELLNASGQRIETRINAISPVSNS
ncbi:PepSY domain-containing protein [Endozoicomonas sp.]|uniref:PepSY domain-containing protein n=1 Tax=Endozoicomonas sp. TaxID=1892382 RepID=UPI0028860A00|nr:PepSY domain-containing protein [Endozoicomonas sp.]